ncbi:MAG: type II toxin-antitoxin system RelE/ParE family toxin [Cytophagales bacterium]|nr:type II toxin-antitoxin system RelE/ParE family toxin [Cytophagales bacterium]MCA6391788.1 type II toxin-antitoxin system RelE/ParE family toxin [Cytophagales bacterium]MCA6393741.1 type II toxin-antitoxin system RelE/ParE family toxin [Cytophagales bacterium]MCA6399040.1 type II toxin-antitoxin system RelE/ParE family toxin [Cytophagales bacterium]MCA6401852.1 type II toxin-antitoxin system RelE/ParE family toxin [Cytophagales bacterium]
MVGRSTERSETIYDFLAEKSQPAAQRVTENILGRAKQLETFPESGQNQETINGNVKEYRYLVEGNYKVIYSYQPESLVVHIEIVSLRSGVSRFGDSAYNEPRRKQFTKTIGAAVHFQDISQNSVTLSHKKK